MWVIRKVPYCHQKRVGERKEELIQWVSLKALKEGRDDDAQFNPGDVIEFMRKVALNTRVYCNRLMKRVLGLISITRLLEDLLPSKLKLLRFCAYD